MTSPLLDGPRLEPAAGGAPRQLVVFLHGYGADGNDLIGLGREWARELRQQGMARFQASGLPSSALKSRPARDRPMATTKSVTEPILA